MEILITNDDGIYAEGLDILVEAAMQIGNVCVVVPEAENSACSHSITLNHPLRIRKIQPNKFVVNGTPTDCVYLGLYEIMPKLPDLVFSGVNHGPNLGIDILYSGTVAGAMEGAGHDIVSFAFSNTSPKSEWNRALLVSSIQEIVLKIKQSGMNSGCLNVNFPPAPFSQFAITKLGKRYYETTVQKKFDPREKPYYWIGGSKLHYDALPGTDFEAIDKGYISITPLDLDMTHFEDMQKLKSIIN